MSSPIKDFTKPQPQSTNDQITSLPQPSNFVRPKPTEHRFEFKKPFGFNGKGGFKDDFQSKPFKKRKSDKNKLTNGELSESANQVSSDSSTNGLRNKVIDANNPFTVKGTENPQSETDAKVSKNNLITKIPSNNSNTSTLLSESPQISKGSFIARTYELFQNTGSYHSQNNNRKGGLKNQGPTTEFHFVNKNLAINSLNPEQNAALDNFQNNPHFFREQLQNLDKTTHQMKSGPPRPRDSFPHTNTKKRAHTRWASRDLSLDSLNLGHAFASKQVDGKEVLVFPWPSQAPKPEHGDSSHPRKNSSCSSHSSTTRDITEIQHIWKSHTTPGSVTSAKNVQIKQVPHVRCRSGPEKLHAWQTSYYPEVSSRFNTPLYPYLDSDSKRKKPKETSGPSPSKEIPRPKLDLVHDWLSNQPRSPGTEPISTNIFANLVETKPIPGTSPYNKSHDTPRNPLNTEGSELEATNGVKDSPVGSADKISDVAIDDFFDRNSPTKHSFVSTENKPSQKSESAKQDISSDSSNRNDFVTLETSGQITINKKPIRSSRRSLSNSPPLELPNGPAFKNKENKTVLNQTNSKPLKVRAPRPPTPEDEENNIVKSELATSTNIENPINSTNEPNEDSSIEKKLSVFPKVVTPSQAKQPKQNFSSDRKVYTPRPPTPDAESTCLIIPENTKPKSFKMRPQSPEMEGWDTSLNTSIDLDSLHDKSQFKNKDKSHLPILKPSLVQTDITINTPSQLTNIKLSLSSIPDQNISPLILNDCKQALPLSSTPSPLAPSTQLLNNSSSEDVKFRTQLKYTGKEFIPNSFLIPKVNLSAESQGSHSNISSFNKKTSLNKSNLLSQSGNFGKNPPLNNSHPPFKYPLYNGLPSDDWSSPEVRDTKFYKIDTSEKHIQKNTRSSRKEFNERNKGYQQLTKNFQGQFISTPHSRNEFPPLPNFNSFNNQHPNPNFPSRHKKTFSREFSSVIEHGTMRYNKKNLMPSDARALFIPSVSPDRNIYLGSLSSNNEKEQAQAFLKHSAYEANTQISSNQNDKFSSLKIKENLDSTLQISGKSKDAKKPISSDSSLPSLDVLITHTEKENVLDYEKLDSNDKDLNLVNDSNPETEIITENKIIFGDLPTINESGPCEESLMSNTKALIEVDSDAKASFELVSDTKAPIEVTNEEIMSIKKTDISLNLHSTPDSNMSEIDHPTVTKIVISETSLLLNSSAIPPQVKELKFDENPWIENNLDSTHSSIKEVPDSLENYDLETCESKDLDLKPISLHDFMHIPSGKQNTNMIESGAPLVSHSDNSEVIDDLTSALNVVSITDSKPSTVDKMESHVYSIQEPSAQVDYTGDVPESSNDNYSEDALQKTNVSLDSDLEDKFSFLNLQEPRELYTLNENTFSPRLDDQSNVFNDTPSYNLPDEISTVYIDYTQASETTNYYTLNETIVASEGSISTHSKRKLHHIPETLELDLNGDQPSELKSTETSATPAINSKSVIARFCFDTPVGPRKLVWTQGAHPWNLVSSFCQKFKITNPNYLEALVHYVIHHSGQAALQS